MTDPITQAAADAIVDAVYGERLPFPPLAIAVVVVAAVTPLIRAQVAAEIEDGVSSVYRQQREFDDGIDVGLEQAARIARGGQQ